MPLILPILSGENSGMPASTYGGLHADRRKDKGDSIFSLEFLVGLIVGWWGISCYNTYRVAGWVNISLLPLLLTSWLASAQQRAGFSICIFWTVLALRSRPWIKRLE